MAIMEDTDNDGLIDSEEEVLSFDPTKPDTDSDGVLDGQEQVTQTTLLAIPEQSSLVIPSVTINSNAEDAESTTITNVGDTYSLLSPNLPGYIAPPYQFNTEVPFSSATMSFEYDASLVGPEFAPAIYYFNETTQMLERVASQTNDPATHTVTATVAHFSTYILLNSEKWDEAWAKEMKVPILGGGGGETNEPTFIDISFAIDSSGSMSLNDPGDLRLEAARNFVEKLRDEDSASVVDFDDYGYVVVPMTSDKSVLKDGIGSIDSSGGTNLYEGVDTAITELLENGHEERNKFIIFLTDGDGYWDDEALERAIENHITIYTIGLGSGVNDTLLEEIATATGGKYYAASASSQLDEIFEDTAEETIDLATDTDKDGISDYNEKEGIRLSTGEWIADLDYLNPDTDGDGRSDGEEVSYYMQDEVTSTTYWLAKSNPLLVDSDGDGVWDKEDSDPLIYNTLTPRQAVVMSQLAYVNLHQYENMKLKDVPDAEFLFSDFYQELQAYPEVELGDWTIVKAEDTSGGSYSDGFGALALSHGFNMVFVFRGTDGTFFANFSDSWNDWVANINIFGKNHNIQIEQAEYFVADVIKRFPYYSYNVTGHSLGGFLSDTISYELAAKDLYGGLHKKAVRKIINSDRFSFIKGYTFNAAPYFTSGYLTEISDNFNPVNFLYEYFSHDDQPRIPLTRVNSSTYDDRIVNYSIDGDPLTKIKNIAGGFRIGLDVGYFEDTFRTREEIEDGETVEGSDKHSIKNFYNYFPKDWS